MKKLKKLSATYGGTNPGNDIVDYIKGHPHEYIADGCYIFDTDHPFESVFANLWTHMGKAGFLFLIDLENPEQQAFYPVNQESEKRFSQDRDALQKRIVAFLTPSPRP